LPFNGEREGTWQVLVTRAAGGGELSSALPEEPFFVTVTATGGPIMKPLDQRKLYYTGDAINPQVVLRYPMGYQVDDPKVTVEVESPVNGTGNVLTTTGLQAATTVGNDQLDARTSTLIQLEQAQGGTLIGTVTNTYPMFDDGERDGDNALEPNGIFGNPLANILRQEGNYTFHARATYGRACAGRREALWSTYVSVGIDPGATKVDIVGTGAVDGGQKQVTIRLTPQDRYGNSLGPGRSDQFGLYGTIGSTLNRPIHDRGDGSYDVGLIWDPSLAPQPGVLIEQPGRPPVIIKPPDPPRITKPCCPMWLCLLLLLLLLIALLVILLH
jgi:hypothetical protein